MQQNAILLQKLRAKEKKRAKENIGGIIQE